MIIQDLFIVDFDSNENIIYANIQNVEKNGQQIIVQHQHLATTLEFREARDSDAFFNELQKRIRP